MNDGDDASLVVVGRVGRPHGRDSAFVVEQPSAAAERFAVGAEVRMNGTPARVLSSKRAGGKLVVELSVLPERGARLEVPRSALPPLAEDSYYVFELVGLEVFSEEGPRLGRIADVLERPANDVIELDSGQLLPLVRACVLDVDLEARRVVIARSFAVGG